MVVVPAVHQWAPEYSYLGQPITGAYAAQMLSVTNETEELTWALTTPSGEFSQILQDRDATTISSVKGPSKYFSKTRTLAVPQLVRTSLATSGLAKKFLAVLSFNHYTMLPAGHRYPRIGHCSDAKYGFRGDLLDNDCDGRIDEEWENGIDDDNDNKIDEDTRYVAGDPSNFDWARPYQCIVSALRTTTDPDKSVTLYGYDSCPSPTSKPGPFFINSTSGHMTHQKGTGYFATGKLKIVYSAEFEIGMFYGHTSLFFSCLFDLCTSYEACNPCIQEVPATPGRKKRSEGTNQVTKEVRVSLPPSGTSEDPGTVEKIVEQPAEVKSCLQNPGIYTLLGVLVATSAVCLASTVYLTCVLKKRKTMVASERSSGSSRPRTLQTTLHSSYPSSHVQSHYSGWGHVKM